MNGWKTIWLLLALFFVAGNAHAYEFEPYTAPLPLGGYVDDVQGLIERAFRYDRWQLQSQPDDSTFIGFISYKGFDITVRIYEQDVALLLVLQSVHQTGCSGDCPDLGEEPVIRWLVNLRRTIAYELTMAVRDHLREKTD